MYYTVCKGIVIFWKHQRFLDKNVWRTHFCDKAFVVLRKSTIFALRKSMLLIILIRYKDRIMTKDNLNQILNQMAEDRFNPRLVDTVSGEYWHFSTGLMACEDGSDTKGLPKDIGRRKALIIEAEMPDESMIEAHIQRGDWLKIRVDAPISSGDVVLLRYNERSYIMTYFKDGDGMKWMVPGNSRYTPICVIDDKNPEVIGRVIHLDRDEMRVEYDDCVKQIEKVKKQMEDIRMITQDHASWAIKQIQSVITVKRWWFPIYRALVQKKLNDEKDYDGFCERIKREMPDHKYLPDPVEIGRLDILGFSKPIEKWNNKDTPVTQRKRFMEYKEIGLRMLDLLECGEETAEEILRKLSDTLKKNS